MTAPTTAWMDSQGDTRRLSVRAPLPGDTDAVLRALGPDAQRWLGEPIADGAPTAAGDGRGGERRRRFATDLRLRVSDRSERTLFRKAALVELPMLGTPWRAPARERHPAASTA